MRLIFFVLCNFFAIISTIGYLKFLKLDKKSDKIIAGTMIYFVRIIIFEFILGYLVKQLNYKAITVCFVIEFIALGIVYKIRKESLYKYLKSTFENALKESKEFKLSWNSVLFIMWFVLFVIVSFIAMYIYEYSYDGNYYHLPHIIDYIQHGRIFETNNTLWNNVYPKDIELLNMFFMLFKNSIRFVRLPQIIFSLVGMVSVYSLLNELGFDKKISFKCACLYFVAPFILVQITTTYIDGIVCTLFITLLYLLIRILKTNKLNYELLFFITMALFIGTKGTCTLYSVIMVIPYIVFKIYNLYTKKEKIVKLFTKEFIFLLIVLIIGGNWMIKNMYYFQNPIHPFKFLNIQGIDANIDIGEDNEPYCIKNKSKAEKIITSWIGLDASYLTFNNGKHLENLYQYHDSRIGGLGIQWLYFLVPNILLAIVLVLAKKYKLSKYHLIVIGILVLSFIITPANWWGRYVGFILVLGYIGCGIVFEVLKNKKIYNIALNICIYTVFILSIKYALHNPLKTFLYENYYNQYPYAFTQYIENGNKNMIVLEQSYYNVNSLVYLKGSTFQNCVDTYYIEEMYPNAKVKNHGIGEYDNFKKIVDSYESLDSIVILDATAGRQNLEYVEKLYNENTELYNKYSYGDDILVYERIK